AFGGGHPCRPRTPRLGAGANALPGGSESGGRDVRRPSKGRRRCRSIGNRLCTGRYDRSRSSHESVSALPPAAQRRTSLPETAWILNVTADRNRDSSAPPSAGNSAILIAPAHRTAVPEQSGGYGDEVRGPPHGPRERRFPAES